MPSMTREEINKNLKDEIKNTLKDTMKIQVEVDLEYVIQYTRGVLAKEKPLKPTKANKNIFFSPILIQCPSCAHTLFESWALEQPKHLPKYCSECGTRIDWSEYE